MAEARYIFKPCKRKCNHDLCAVRRIEAQMICPYCLQPLGHDKMIIRADDDSLAHLTCQAKPIKDDHDRRLSASLAAVQAVAAKYRTND